MKQLRWQIDVDIKRWLITQGWILLQFLKIKTERSLTCSLNCWRNTSFDQSSLTRSYLKSRITSLKFCKLSWGLRKRVECWKNVVFFSFTKQIRRWRHVSSKWGTCDWFKTNQPQRSSHPNHLKIWRLERISWETKETV